MSQDIEDKFEMHFFRVHEAVSFGTDPALLLSNLRFWLKKNKANNVNNHDGYIWTYNSTRAFEILFPYMTRRSISRHLAKLESEGVIMSGNYNKSSYDRTKWYTIYGEFMVNSDGDDDKELTNVSDSVGYISQSIGHISQCIGQVGQPIPDRNTDRKTNKESIVQPSCTSRFFEQFWLAYPSKKNKKRALAIWVKNKLDDDYTAIMSNLAKRKRCEVNWFDCPERNLQFIPMPSTFLNGHRWKDEVEDSHAKCKCKGTKKAVTAGSDWFVMTD